MIVFHWCVRAHWARQRTLVTGLIIFLLLASYLPYQINHVEFAAGMTVDACREDAVMSRKLNLNARQKTRRTFQFEHLEPREMFSVSGGSALDEAPTALPTPDVHPPVEALADQGLDNFQFLPVLGPVANGSAQVLTPVQLNGRVYVNSNIDLSVQWSKVSGPGTATFADGSKIDTTVQFSLPGTYVLKLAAINNGYSQSGLLTLTVTGAVATDPTAPELFDTTYSLPTGGTTHTPANGTEFQAALNAAQPGDVIVLQAGTTYKGNFSLPKKQGDGWIYIVSSKLSQLAVDERVGLDDAVNMPKLVAADNQLPVIRTEFGSHHYRLAGIEVTTDADKLDLIRTGYGIPDGGTVWNITPADTNEKLPHHITFDRMLIHSTSDTNRLRHGIMLNGNHMAVVNSYIANIKDGADAQAIFTFNGGAHYKIVNNFLEATGENAMFGGTDPIIPGGVPSDIEFRGNHLFKRLNWKTNDLWGIKNLFEVKNAQRLLVVGNVMENNWADGQNGTAVLFTVRNQGGTASWSVVQDVNFENNIVKNVGSGIAITGEDDLQSSQQTKRIRIHNNLFENVTGDYSPGPEFIYVGTPNRPVLNLTVTHNTFLSALDENGPLNHIAFKSPRINVDGLILKDNIMVHGSYNPDWARVAHAQIANNLLIMLPGDSRYSWNKSEFNQQHPGWLMADPGFGAVGFVDYQNGNYALGANSPYKNAASDGSAVGANISDLNQVINQVAVALGASVPVVVQLPHGEDYWILYPLDAYVYGSSESVDALQEDNAWQLEAPTMPNTNDSFFEAVGQDPTQRTTTINLLPEEPEDDGETDEVDEQNIAPGRVDSFFSGLTNGKKRRHAKLLRELLS